MDKKKMKPLGDAITVDATLSKINSKFYAYDLLNILKIEDNNMDINLSVIMNNFGNHLRKPDNKDGQVMSWGL